MKKSYQSFGCIVNTYLSKAILAILFLPIMIIIGHIGLSRGGASYLDVPILIYKGELVWWRQIISLACGILWAARYYPPSWSVLRHSKCAIAELNNEFIILGKDIIPKHEIDSIIPVSNLIKKGISINTIDGNSYYVSSIITNMNDPRKLADLLRSKLYN